MNETLIAPPGLKGVLVADTALGDVRGAEGFYHYREYPAVPLARDRSLEAVWSLLWEGALPDARALARFRAEVGELRRLPEGATPLLAEIARRTPDPVAGLRAALPLLVPGAPTVDLRAPERRAQTMRAVALVPTLLAALVRIARGERPLDPDPSLGHAADYLRMVTGHAPDTAHARALETYLVATLDHGFNASTFAARVITSTGADVVSAIAGASGALSGPLHGGAPGRALEMIEAIGDPARCEAWLDAELARGGKIMGFGHAVYRTEDPRSVLLREVARGLGSPLVARAEAIEREILRVLRARKPDATIQTNVEYYAGVVMELCGMPRAMFTPSFTVSRAIGWGAHILEQAAANKIIRPSARYTGPAVLSEAPR
jgi:citrate synthase